jgi:redox-sensitive bicupin YhaK (pirin superfamily)
MSSVRKVAHIIKGVEATDGAGVKLVRLFGLPHTASFDPFLMMDGFDSVDPKDYLNGFPWHPHRGIEGLKRLFYNYFLRLFSVR